MYRSRAFASSFLGLLFLITGVSVNAQGGNSRLSRQGSIQGLVRLPGGQPAPQGVMINLENDPVGHISTSQTDSQGKFTFIGVASPGVYIVKAKHTGFRESVLRVDLTVSPNGYVVVELQPLESSPAEASRGAVSASALAVPEAARKEFDRGRELLVDKHSAAKSIRNFQKAIETYPNYAQAHFMLGTALMETGKPLEAQKSLEEAIRIDEQLGGAHLALGTLHSAQGKLPEAEKSLLRGMELEPGVAGAHYELAKVYWAMGKPLDAEKPARKAIEMQKTLAAAHLLLGNILLRKRDAPGALAAYQEYLRLEPNGPMAPGARDMVQKIEAALKKP